jgi:hypothetical protein
MILTAGTRRRRGGGVGRVTVHRCGGWTFSMRQQLECGERELWVGGARVETSEVESSPFIGVEARRRAVREKLIGRRRWVLMTIVALVTGVKGDDNGQEGERMGWHGHLSFLAMEGSRRSVCGVW